MCTQNIAEGATVSESDTVDFGVVKQLLQNRAHGAHPRQNTSAFKQRLAQVGIVNADAGEHIGFEQLNRGFDQLSSGAVVRQILLPHGAP